MNQQHVRLPKGWKPLSAGELASKCDSYVAYHQGTIKAPRPPGTKAGLALELDLERVKDLDVLTQFPRYGKAIRQALMRLEDQRAADLANPLTKNARGIEFDLCNNFGWVDAKKVSLEDNRARVLRLPKRKPVGAPVEDTGGKKVEGKLAAVPAEVIAEAANG